jgi:hypothetical protein
LSVDLGDQRLRPERRRKAEPERRRYAGQAAGRERATAHTRRPQQRAEEGAREVDAIGDRAEGRCVKEVADQREEREAGRMLYAEIARKDEQPIVLRATVRAVSA